MAIRLTYEKEAIGVAFAMLRVEKDWPDLPLLQWVEADSDYKRALWIIENGHWWHVWDRDNFLGYVAGIPVHGRHDRWAFHFGGIRGVNHLRVMPRVWRIFLRIAEAHKVRLIVAYIPTERRDIQRLAKIFHFRRFKNLWAIHQKCQKSRNRNRRPKPRLP